MRWGGCLLALITLTPSAFAHPDSGPARRSAAELGQVRWWRDSAGARAEAKKSGKPLLILFDEVPG
jgi:hypothetical protein